MVIKYLQYFKAEFFAVPTPWAGRNKPLVVGGRQKRFCKCFVFHM